MQTERTLRGLVIEPDVATLTKDEMVLRNAIVELAEWCQERLPLLEQGRSWGFRMALSEDALSAVEAALPEPDGERVVANLLRVDGQ